MIRAQMTFPPDFRWGTTAVFPTAHHNPHSDWGDDTPSPVLWWKVAEADILRAAAMGVNAYRFALEWSLIEPEPAVFDTAVFDQYRHLLQLMHDNGIEPMVSLHHFSNPRWLSDKNDFHNRVVVDYFQRYAANVVDVLGDLIPKWITVNEPLVYVYQRYINGKFPSPTRTGWQAALEATRNLLRCHAAAYQAIKAKLPDAEVGVAKQMAVFQPRNPRNLLDRWWSGRIRHFFNEVWMESMENGRFSHPLGRGKVDGLAGSFDFIGLNYDTRFYVRFQAVIPPRRPLLESDWGETAVMSDHNFSEVYPDGLFQLISSVLKYDKPIYITSSGLPDAGDGLRPAFIIAHLREVWRAISFCFPVMGYYHHSLTDAAEWQHEWKLRFGLFAVDRESGDRHPRPSAALYGDICQHQRIDSAMTAKYAPALLPVLFPAPTMKVVG